MKVEIRSEIACLRPEDSTLSVCAFVPAKYGVIPGQAGAPFFVIDGRYAVAGVQDTDTLFGILRQVWDETLPTVLGADNEEAICGPDGCAIPADHSVHA